MIKRALLRLESGFERILVGRREPTPKSIRDLGRTVAQAKNVQLVIDWLNHDHTHYENGKLVEDTPTNRWDDMGRYLEDEDE